MVNASRDAVGRLGRSVAVMLVLLAVVSASASTSAAAAGATTVWVDAANERVTVSETTTVHLVVDGVDGGVGAYDLAVALSDPSVATITDVTLLGEPRLRTVEIAENGARADLKAALMDTEDAGRIAVAAVTLSGVAPGTTDVSVSVSALGAEDGSRYPTEVGAASVTVGAVEAFGAGDHGSTPGPDSVGDSDGADADSVDDADDAPDDSTAGDDPAAESADGADGLPGGDESEAPDDSVAALDAPPDAERPATSDGRLPFGSDASTWAAALAAVTLAAALLAARRRR